jgi:hypothetical protein
LKKFAVTFTEKTGSKYQSRNTRTVDVITTNEYSASNAVSSMFDSFKMNKDLHMPMPTGRNISIDKVDEIEMDEKEKIKYCGVNV